MTGRELIAAAYAACDGDESIMDRDVTVAVTVGGHTQPDETLYVDLSHVEYDGPVLGILIQGDPA